jgi:hypothetical protein
VTLLDTSDLSFQESVEAVLEVIRTQRATLRPPAPLADRDVTKLRNNG